MWQTLKQGRSWIGLVKNRCKNGDHYWVDAFASPITQNGEVVEYQSVRTKPKQEWVQRADAVYRRLMAGKRVRLTPMLPFTARVLLWQLPLMFAVVGLGYFGALSEWMGVGMLLIASLVGIGQYAALSPMRAVIRRAEEIVDNPVARYVYTGRKDAAGQIQLAFRVLDAESRALTGRMADAVQQLEAAAQTLAVAGEQAAKGAEAQFADSDQVAAAVNQMASGVQEVAHSAQRTSNTSDEGRSQTGKGQQVVEMALQAIRSLHDDLSQTAAVIHQVQNSSDTITAVLDVIQDIADQTNLLALNAAIEAARAGESGRGFAVVAEEVRNLSARTSQSTNNIRDMIAQLQATTASAVESMQRGQQIMTDCMTHGQGAVAALDEIYRMINNIADMSLQVSAAVEQQGLAAEEINRNIVHIRELSSESTAASAAVMETCHDMQRLSGALKALADQFWMRKRGVQSCQTQ
jgi:methyl-accepting chemotaxis protein